jgi:hypothetical protein
VPFSTLALPGGEASLRSDRKCNDAKRNDANSLDPGPRTGGIVQGLSIPSLERLGV